MADLYPAVGLGDAVFPILVIPMKCESAVTKGQVVVYNTHTAGELPSVSAAGANAESVAGVALKSGGAGEVIPVLVKGIVKVTGTGAITMGNRLVTGAAGVVAAMAADTFTALQLISRNIGWAMQTFASGDTGLIFVDR